MRHSYPSIQAVPDVMEGNWAPVAHVTVGVTHQDVVGVESACQGQEPRPGDMCLVPRTHEPARGRISRHMPCGCTPAIVVWARAQAEHALSDAVQPLLLLQVHPTPRPKATLDRCRKQCLTSCRKQHDAAARAVFCHLSNCQSNMTSRAKARMRGCRHRARAWEGGGFRTWPRGGDGCGGDGGICPRRSQPRDAAAFAVA